MGTGHGCHFSSFNTIPARQHVVHSEAKRSSLCFRGRPASTASQPGAQALVHTHTLNVCSCSNAVQQQVVMERSGAMQSFFCQPTPHKRLAAGRPAQLELGWCPTVLTHTVAAVLPGCTCLSVGRLLPASLPPSLMGVNSAVMLQQPSSCMMALWYEFPSAQRAS
jgi:hypothetical protein